MDGMNDLSLCTVMTRRPKNSSVVRDLAMGVCLGAANIIPGVSGGTFLLIFGIYDRVFSILANIHKTNLIAFFKLVRPLVSGPGRTLAIRDLQDFLNRNDFIFLVKLMAGAITAIVSLSSLMEYLMTHHFSVTYALFFGLILISIVIPVRLIKQKRVFLVVFGLMGAAITLYVTIAVNPYDKVRMKSARYEAQYLKSLGSSGDGSDSLEKAVGYPGYSKKYTFDEYLYAFVCGAVAISAMVLPGISGSLVLILMGAYFEVVSAISELTTLDMEALFFLIWFSLGIVLGGLLFARLISAVLKRYHDPTMAFLTGLVVGSLYPLWPFKKSVIMARQFIKSDAGMVMLENVKVYTNVNILPQMDLNAVMAFVAFAAGCLIMMMFIRAEKRA